MEYTFYKIACNDTAVTFTYIGSTKNFRERKWQHKYDSANPKKNTIKLYKTINENGGWSNWNIVPIGKGVFDDRLSARIEEQKYIEQNNANLNSFRALMTKEQEDEMKRQYVINNHERRLQTQKDYREKHKDELKEKYNSNTELQERRKEKIQCPCGGSYTYSHKAEHCRSAKHLAFVGK
jgi:hypothetical protein